MYLRPETVVSDRTAVEQFLETHPLGLLTTAILLSGQATIQASHLPFLFNPPIIAPITAAELSKTPLPSSSNSVSGTWNSGPDAEHPVDLGTLRCHLARSNPQAKALLSLSESSTQAEEVLIVFSDPTNNAGYITPQWYQETKPATAKTVPTWNYTELQLYGHVSLTSPSQIVRDLSDKHEQLYADKIGRGDKWKVEDAPEKYIELLKRAIIGVEIKITRVAYKMKMSREKPVGDRQGVIDGLRELGFDAEKIAETIVRLGPMKTA